MRQQSGIGGSGLWNHQRLAGSQRHGSRQFRGDECEWLVHHQQGASNGDSGQRRRRPMTAPTKSPSACLVTGVYKGDLTCANNPASVVKGFGTTTIEPVVGGARLSPISR